MKMGPKKFFFQTCPKRFWAGGIRSGKVGYSKQTIFDFRPKTQYQLCLCFIVPYRTVMIQLVAIFERELMYMLLCIAFSLTSLPLGITCWLWRMIVALPGLLLLLYTQFSIWFSAYKIAAIWEETVYLPRWSQKICLNSLF